MAKLPSFLYCTINIVLLVLYANNSHCTNVTESEIDWNHLHSEDVQNEYIVMFKKYRPLEEHGIVLKKILGDLDGWEIIPRNNPSTSMPSDFSLLKLSGKYTFHSFERILSSSPEVKRIFPQRRFTTSILKSTEVKEAPLKLEIDVSKLDEPFRLFGNHTGRLHTKFSHEDMRNPHHRKLHSNVQVPELFNAQILWEKGFTGTGVKVGVFDTGLRANHPHFRNIAELKNWSNEDTVEDGLGHGTFVAGVIASQTDCLGFAPDAELHIFRVFTNKRVSYTSWFLDAFNYAILTKINILNLSIGGPDFLDLPFVEKVWELSANNIIVISAIGNDGPLYGTLNNPADQLDAIGVGAIDFGDKLAEFSSRGMTTWELPEGYGRVKPDVLAYGQSVQGSRPYGGCRALSGTSVASPVVAGAVTLLASAFPESERWDIINPASMKQALIYGAERLPENNIFEQGYGKMNLLETYAYLSAYVPHVTAYPMSLDLTDCPYMWPYCSQPLYFGAMPVIVNMTVINGMGVAGEFESEPVWKPGNNGDLLEISFSHSELLWPWSGYLSLQMRATKEAAFFNGEVEGVIVADVVSPPGPGETQLRRSKLEIPLKVRIIPTPPRQRRILWHQYHNLRYPTGYFPRDALDHNDEPFDWNADHIHTNFKTLYNFLRNKGYFIEVLSSPFTCFDASQYGTLLIVDAEEEFFPDEIQKLMDDINKNGLNLVVIADWYNVDVMSKIKFFDENTRQWWTPATGGANIPALNDLLNDFGIAFSDEIFIGDFDQEGRKDQTSVYASGSTIARFPPGGSLMHLELRNQGKEIRTEQPDVTRVRVPVLGFYPTNPETAKKLNSTGRLAVFGDSSCMDDASKRSYCFNILEHMIAFAAVGSIDEKLGLDTRTDLPFKTPNELPKRMPGNELHKYSKVIEHSAVCKKINYRKYDKTAGEIIEINWPKHISGVTNPHGRMKEGSSARENVYFDNESATSAPMGTAFLPYVFGIVVVVFVVVIAIKSRKEKSIPRRIQV